MTNRHRLGLNSDVQLNLSYVAGQRTVRFTRLGYRRIPADDHPYGGASGSIGKEFRQVLIRRNVRWMG